MIALGLDPSLTGFGWCLHENSVVGPRRVIARGQIKTTSGKLIYQRYMYLYDGLLQLLEKYSDRFVYVGVESPPFGESYSEGLYGLFLYVNQALMLYRKNVVYFDPMRVKSLAKMDPTMRKGVMDKSDMVEASKADTGIKKWNHNEADAYIISRSAARFWQYQRGDIVDSALTPSELSIYPSILKKPNDRFYLFEDLFPDQDSVFKRTLLELGD